MQFLLSLGRNRYVLLADVLVIALAAWLSFALRFGWLFMSNRDEFPLFIGAAIVSKVAVYYLFGLYRRYWRYASFWDFMAVALATSVASILFGVVIVGARVALVIPGLSRSVLPVDWLLTLVMTGGVRASVRILAETFEPRTRRRGRSRRVLVIGAGDAGVLVVREMQRNPQLGMMPVSFLDDDPAKHRKRIFNVPVVGPLSMLGPIIQSRQVDEVVIALPRAGGAIVRAVAERCRQHGVAPRVVPGVYELLDGKLRVQRLREVDIADLLRRPQVTADGRASDYLEGETVLVTGAGGSIGSELCRQVASANPAHMVLLGHGENSVFEIAAELRHRFPQVSIQTVIADIRDRDRISRILNTIRPDAIFHAAAHKHVPLMEENIAEAITNNVLGTRNVVDAACAAGTRRLVFISTDKAAAPTSVMGASKRIAEMIVREAARQEGRSYVVVRFGNVLGSRGSVVPMFRSQIERGGPVTVTHPEVRRYFMTIPEAVHLVLQAGGLGRGGELFVLDMGEPVLLKDMAADMIRLSGFELEEIPIVFIGLRPGEKLEEVLWEDDATVLSTAQPDIRRVLESGDLSSDRIGEFVNRLIDAAPRSESRVIRLLREAIPTATLKVQMEKLGGVSERQGLRAVVGAGQGVHEAGS